ncbi:unnamed protein product [marine sediment metagenome]|uniref:Uncharacterized protein n=1 Tax=marine sediment metagenome TaxID=412755 RepID=X1M573_9ZZZZ
MNGHITPLTPHIITPSRGQTGAMAAGDLTEIVSIIAPASVSLEVLFPGKEIHWEVRRVG